MPIERLSIKRMRDLVAFPTVLEDLNFKFFLWSMRPAPPPPLVCSYMLYHSVHSKERATNKITDKLPVNSFVYNLTILMRKQKSFLRKGCGKWENREVRIDLAKKISWLRPWKLGAKLFVGPIAACNATILVCAKSFFKKGSCVHLPYSVHNARSEKSNCEGGF